MFHFFYDFLEEYFSYYILLSDQISLSGCLYLFEILGNMCIAIICDCDVKNFEINLFIKAFLYYITIFKEFAVNKRNIFGS